MRPRHQPRSCSVGARCLRGVDRQDSGQAAVRCGRHGADESHSLDFTRRERSLVPRDHVRPVARVVQRASARIDRGGLGRASHRDDFRHSQRQGRHRRRDGDDGRDGRRPAADDLGHDHGSQWSHADGSDDRGVLGFRVARATAHCRDQLRPRCGRHAPVSGRPLESGGLFCDLLPKRRIAKRVR